MNTTKPPKRTICTGKCSHCKAELEAEITELRRMVFSVEGSFDTSYVFSGVGALCPHCKNEVQFTCED